MQDKARDVHKSLDSQQHWRLQSINQSKRIYIAPHITSESEAWDGRD